MKMSEYISRVRGSKNLEKVIGDNDPIVKLSKEDLKFITGGGPLLLNGSSNTSGSGNSGCDATATCCCIKS